MAVRLATRSRWWAGCLAATCAGLAVAFRVDPGAYQAPIFSTAQQVVSLDGWAVAWGLCGVAAAWCCVTASAWAWRAASLGALALSSGWWFALAYGHWVEGDRLSWSGFALWGWFAASTALMATSPTQWERRG